MANTGGESMLGVGLAIGAIALLLLAAQRRTAPRL